MPVPARALILAAGRGSRMAGRSQAVPKPLLSVDGTPEGPSFLAFHLARLAQAGVREVVLVGNETTFETPLPVPGGLEVRWVMNPVRDLSRSGSGHSMSLALEAEPRLTDGSADLLLMDADILYPPAVMHQAIRDLPGLSLVLVHPECAITGEEVHVFATPHAPGVAVRQGKGLTETPMVEALRLVGEATGIVRFAATDQAALRQASAWVLTRSTARQRSEHEDITGQLMACGRMHIALLPPGTPFTECDTAEDYLRMTQHIWPRVNALLG
jgi:choline kinase